MTIVSVNKCHLFVYVIEQWSLTCLSSRFSELTHEFLQILEKTPSRLKRIRNWRVNHKYSLDNYENSAGRNV